MTAYSGKTLVILTPGFPASEEDTNCLPAQQIFIRSVNRIFPEIDIVICSFEYPSFKGSYRWYGNTVHSFDAWGKGKFGRLKAWLGAWRKMRHLQRHFEVVGILSFWLGECTLIGKYFGKFRHVKHLGWILGQDARKNNRFIRWIAPRSEELVALSDSLSVEFQANYGVEPRYIVPNGVDTTQFSPTDSTRDIDVLGVGSLISLKQYDLFVRIFGELSARTPSLRAVICGKGPEEENLKSLIKHLGLEDRISLTGELPHPQVLSLMQRSRLLLHTSSYEGFSSACLEALYAGAHVVSFCRPMNQSIGHWHVAANEEEMREFVIQILQNPNADYSSVLPYRIEDSARTLINLFVLN